MMDPNATLVACRFLLYGAAMFLWGSSAYLGFLVPVRPAREVQAMLGTCQRIAIALVIAMAVVLLPLRAATIGDGWSDAINVETLQAVLLETNVGLAWMASAAAVLLLLPAMLIRPPRRQAGIAVVSAVLLATLSLTGHVSMNSGWLGILHRVNDIVHLLSAGAWIGALVPVLLILAILQKAGSDFDAWQALSRFSIVGHFAVALTIGTGLANTYFIVGHLPLDWSFPYQALLALKITIVGAMIVLALVNRYVFVPRASSHKSGGLQALARGARTEIVLGIVVLLLVAWFGTLEPM